MSEQGDRRWPNVSRWTSRAGGQRTGGARDLTDLVSDLTCSEASEVEDISQQHSTSHRKAKDPAQAYHLIDRDRQEAGVRPLRRSEDLQKLAFRHAAKMSQRGKVNHSVKTLEELQVKLNSQHVGENVQRGDDIEAMHERAMTKFEINRNNVLGPDFTEYGIATIYGKDGHLYMCQYFR